MKEQNLVVNGYPVRIVIEDDGLITGIFIGLPNNNPMPFGEWISGCNLVHKYLIEEGIINPEKVKYE